MSRIEKKFTELREKGQKGLIAYITAGDPNLKTTQNLVQAFEEGGVDLVELGVPFSDPLADGVVNQWAAMRSLSAGTTVEKILKLVERIRKGCEIPIVLFTYLNPILRYGFKRFAKEAKEAGVDGLLVLDLPPEEGAEYKKTMVERGIDTIFLISPTSSPTRMNKIAQEASGFIYCVSRTGVTGPREDIPQEASDLIQRIRKISTLPIAVGFGISNARQVAQLAPLADAVVVGSAIVKKIEKNVRHPRLVKTVMGFVKELVQTAHAYDSEK